MKTQLTDVKKVVHNAFAVWATMEKIRQENGEKLTCEIRLPNKKPIHCVLRYESLKKGNEWMYLAPVPDDVLLMVTGKRLQDLRTHKEIEQGNPPPILYIAFDGSRGIIYSDKLFVHIDPEFIHII